MLIIFKLNVYIIIQLFYNAKRITLKVSFKSFDLSYANTFSL